jgi:hypothetical protein
MRLNVKCQWNSNLKWIHLKTCIVVGHIHEKCLFVCEMEIIFEPVIQESSTYFFSVKFQKVCMLRLFPLAPNKVAVL